VIVRIATEGQFRLPDEQSDRLNQLDNDVVAAVEAGDQERFRQLFDEMIELVRSQGEDLGEDELVESEVILPPPDTSLEDAREEFTGEGLIPG
jgi:PspAA-like protein